METAPVLVAAANPTGKTLPKLKLLVSHGRNFHCHEVMKIHPPDPGCTGSRSRSLTLSSKAHLLQISKAAPLGLNKVGWPGVWNALPP